MKESIGHIEITGFSTQAVETALRFLHSGTSSVLVDDLVEVGAFADKYAMGKLNGHSEQRGRAAMPPASAETEVWLHRLDAELPRRQASSVQLRCEAEDGVQKHVLVISGAYPLKAVGKTIAEAFGMAVDAFDPHPNKGRIEMN